MYTRSRGRDLIKARREAPGSFVAQRPPATCPLHTALCETGECRIRVAWLVFTSDERNAGSRGRNKRLSIGHVNSFRCILSVYTATERCVGEIFDRFYYWMDKVVICTIVNTLSSNNF